MSNAAALSHPHIIRFLGAYIQSGYERFLCILLEFAAGGTLEEDVQRQHRLGRSYDSGVVVLWLTQLAMALSYMHGKRVLHRDLSSGKRTPQFMNLGMY